MRQDPALTVAFQLHARAAARATAPEAARLDDDAVDAAVQHGARGHPDADYALLEKNGERLDHRRGLAEHYARELDGFAQVGTLKGTELIGRTYEPLFPFFATQGAGAFVVLGGDFIELGEGTGVVHIAPAFGEDDMNVAKPTDIPVVDPVDFEGNFTAEVPPYEGKNVFEANKDIIRDLKAAAWSSATRPTTTTIRIAGGPTSR